MFHQEIATLDWRTHELADVVDQFIVVESVRTHSGLLREPVHPERDPRFAWLGSRLSGIVAENPPDGPDPWLREQTQREAIWTEGAVRLTLDADDLVIISDIDEVPFPEVVDRLAHAELDVPVLIRPMWFNFNWQTYLGKWEHPSIRCYSAGLLRRVTEAGNSAAIGKCALPGRELEGLNGWHASWFGPDEAVLAKLRSYAHATDDKDQIAIAGGVDGIQRRRASGWDMHGNAKKRSAQPLRLPVYGHLLQESF